MSAGTFGRGFGLPYSERSLAPSPTPGQQPTPRIPANDPEYERAQPITRDDRVAILRRYFRGRGLSEAQTDAAMREAKV